MAKLFKVGGCVRDSFLGVKSKDIDYAVEAPSFAAMRDYILEKGGKIYLEKPEYLTIRAKIGKEDADFVLCRKDGSYSDGRRPNEVVVGTIDDDLARRDFTMNAIAWEVNAKGDPFYDPFGGVQDIAARRIHCVGDAYERFNEDPLRILRAIRFSITKQMTITAVTYDAMVELQSKVMSTVSVERVREELYKCFAFNTIATLNALQEFEYLRNSIFEGNTVWLQPTMKH